MVDKGAGHGHPLLLSSGQLRRLVLDTVAEAEEVEYLPCPPLGLGRGFAGYQGRYHHILQRRELREELVELKDKAYMSVPEGRELLLRQRPDVGTVDGEASAVGMVQCAKYLEQRGLARTTGADDGDDLAVLYLQRYAFQHLQRAEGLGYILCVYHINRLRIDDG